MAAQEETTGSMHIMVPVAPIRNQVVAKLRSAIVHQHFLPGDRLRERELCEFVGASRSSVREALRQLETEGLVEMLANRGPVVAKASPQDAQEIYEVRRVLEGLAARLCAVGATVEHMRQLQDVVARMEVSISEDRVEDLLDLKDEFYEVVFAGAGNSLVKKLLGSLHARVRTLRLSTMTHAGRPQQTLREIREIVSAIEQHDPDRADVASQAHVLAAASVALQTHAVAESAGLGPTSTIAK